MAKIILLATLLIAVCHTGQTQIVSSSGQWSKDGTQLLSQIQSHLLQLQTIVSDHGHLFMDIQKKINNLSETDKHLSRNLTDQEQAMLKDIQHLQRQMVSSHAKMTNVTITLKDLSSAVSRMQKYTDQQNMFNLLLTDRINLLTKLALYSQYQTSYYYYVSSTLSWDDAANYCKKIHPQGHLATIQSQGENDFIAKLLPYGATSFLGGHDRVQENKWQWENGETFNYTNWSPGEPNNGASREHCIIMYQNNKQWNDAYCTPGNSFVCEIDS
ncbi:low affinity immunoglobulin epsilon Fc receptor isoform X1 [Lingula anatina]|uniref:Low affinity immunoglobulin epsilon Fc receptor isoform X1 n=1 Tax=Lingula anatina TaxID=7574 RepID=A0A1S3I7J6_LINAN|nr:low affinity immunoglobulin epsilon Fc receptor isoform X1 [Lingula anatina]|eukprot:XP_013393354.1 low affinity immunoglobulin epsilon Fc receptor isoform X1 [Lingula anatina]